MFQTMLSSEHIGEQDTGLASGRLHFIREVDKLAANGDTI